MDHVHPQITPPVWWQGGHIRCSAQRVLHLLQRDLHELGIAVRPVAFIGRPIGAQIPLLEHMHCQTGSFCDPDRIGMVTAHIAVKHEVRGLRRFEPIFECARPLGQIASKIQQRRPVPPT